MPRLSIAITTWAVSALLAGLLLTTAVSADEPPEPGAKETTKTAEPAGAEPAEPEKPAEKPAPAADKTPDDEPAGDDAPGGKEPGSDMVDAAAALKTYQAKIAEWKEVIRTLRDLRTTYQLSNDEEEIKEIREKWQANIEKGNSLIAGVEKAARDAYAASPGSNREVTRFLVKVLEDHLQRDDFLKAEQLALLLGKDKSYTYQANLAAGHAAFALNKFDLARERFDKAAKVQPLPEALQAFSSLIDENNELPDLREQWKEELALREAEAKQDDLPRVRITTNRGPIVLELFEDQAPETVANFVELVEKGFYDGVVFHRVLPGFMAQGGDPQGTGAGGPGYSIRSEFNKKNARKHFSGVISMANSGPNTGGSQFFLTFAPQPMLNGRHTVFGRIINGQEVLPLIQRRDPDGTPPLPEPDKIVKAEVIRKRDHEYKASPIKGK